MTIANKSLIYNTNLTCWLNPVTGSYNIPVFRPGETVYSKEGIASAFTKYKDGNNNIESPDWEVIFP